MDRSNLQTGIWLIGLGVLFLTGYWWPGIMFLIGLSVIAAGSYQAATWLIGIGVLALFDFWWPGILFVIGISLIVQTVLPDREELIEEDDFLEFGTPPQESPVPVEPEPELTESPAPVQTAQPVKRTMSDGGWLPGRCPACGGPLTPQTAIWHEDHNAYARCPWCESIVENPDN